MSNDLIALELNYGATDSAAQSDKTPNTADTTTAFVQRLRLLLHCMMMHAVEADIPLRIQFQRQIGGISSSLHDESSLTEVDMAVAQTIRAFEDYHQQASETFKLQGKELRDLVSSMAEAVAFMATETETSMKQLGLAQTKLRRAIQVQDPREMKTCVQESLSLIFTESKRMEFESRVKTEALGAEVERLKDLLQSAKLVASEDPTTGLPGRAAAEQAIEENVSGGNEFSVALFVIDRLVSINGRFGRFVGDQVLVNGAIGLAGRLRGATLYRWSGPCFLAIFDPSLSARIAEASAKQAAGLRLEKEFQIGERNALVVITSTLHLQRVDPASAASAVIQAIDACLITDDAEGK